MASFIAPMLPPLRPLAAAVPAFIPLGELFTAPPPGKWAIGSAANVDCCGEASVGSAKSRSTSAGSSSPHSTAGIGGSVTSSPILGSDRFGLDTLACTPVTDSTAQNDDGFFGTLHIAHAEHARRALLQGFAAVAADAELPLEKVLAPNGLALPPGLEKAFIDPTSPLPPPPGLCGSIAPPPLGLGEEAFQEPLGLEASPHGCGALAVSVCLTALCDDEEDVDNQREEDEPQALQGAPAHHLQQQQRCGVPPPPALPPNFKGTVQAAEPHMLPPSLPVAPPPPSFAAPSFAAPSLVPPPPLACPGLCVSPPTAAAEPLGFAPVEVCPPPAAPALGSVEMPTKGSAGHMFGTCKPCAFLYTKGCTSGVACLYCHLCDAGEKQRRKKEKRAIQTAARKGGL
mmetsp:Transcript_57323/g.149366  ORF Transcript_57323/g.149366 Transcript_57323/m.149366 type:complete len:399 (-) Transcript_57323:267-1463(-)